MPVYRTMKIERLAFSGGTLKFFVRPGSRSRPWIWFPIEDVPPFEGHSAEFVCERIKGGWKVLRRANGGGAG